MQITFTYWKIEIESKLIKPGKMKGKKGSKSPALISQKSTAFPPSLSPFKRPMCLASQRLFEFGIN